MAKRSHDTDLLFKALADPSRRRLLDLLHAHDGRTLGELCLHLDMTRQGVTQHLELLEEANLVVTIRATLAGDLATLRKSYLVVMKQPLPHWRIELTPIAGIEEQTNAGVTQISMAGDGGEVERIEFTEASGDRTELLLSPVR